MKKSVLFLSLCLLAGTVAKAEALTGPSIPEIPGLPMPSGDVLDCILSVDTEEFARCIIKSNPLLGEKHLEAIMKVIDLYKAMAAKNQQRIETVCSWINGHIAEVNEIIGIANPYLENILPLYVYQMKNRVTPEMADTRAFTLDTIWAAPIDEIYYGLGDPRNSASYNPYGLNDYEIAEGLANGGRVKHNQSYLWGLVSVGSKVYWCTNTNYLCVGGASSGLGSNAFPGQDVSGGYENACWVCEFGSGQYGKDVHGQVDPAYTEYSDTRIPRIYCFDTNSGEGFEDITPQGLSPEYDFMLQNCQGLRSAGAHHGVVFFGGPSLYGSSAGTTVGSSFFALDADTNEFLGCNDMSDVEGNTITDIRRWMVYDDVLYCGVRLTDVNGVDRGAVLRWYGDKENPWQFKVVGWMAAEAAELVVYNDRMYVGGWNTESIKKCTVHKGPVVPEGGLQPVGLDDPEWPIVWDYQMYDKNAISSNITYTAGMKVWKGKLYWGTFAAAYIIPGLLPKFGYDDLTDSKALAFVLGQLRQTSFWRIDENDEIELLYGESELPRWDRMTQFDQYGRPVGPDTWTLVSNGFTPKYGRAGYGQPFTAYSWTIEEYHGDLYVGTMNMNNLVGGVLSESNGLPMSLLSLLKVREDDYGFELVRFQDPEVEPEYITRNGFGNGTAYGIRNFTVCGDDLFIGSASPLNLKQYGGCHLFRLHEDLDEDYFGPNYGGGQSDGTTTGIQALQTKPGVVFKRGNGQLTIASLQGEDIQSITIYDAAGRAVVSTNPGSHVTTVNTAGVKGASVVRIVSSKGTFTLKVAL